MLQTYTYPTVTFDNPAWEDHPPHVGDWYWAVVKTAEHLYGVTEDDLKGYSRARHIVVPRQLAMCAMRELSGISLAETGKRFNRGHTTVMHAARRFPAGSGALEHFVRKARQLVEGGA